MPELAIRDEAHWHELRAHNVGASEVSALFGCQPAYAMSHYTLWQVKAGRIPPPEVNSERAEWGLRLEKEIARAACAKEGWFGAVDCGYWQHETIKGLGCTPDFTALKTEGAEFGVLEVKNADWLIHKRQWGDEPPPHILLQLQTQLACTGYEWGAIACLVGGNELHVYQYGRRPKIIAEIERRVTEFWQSIDEGREPPIDNTESTARAVASLYPHDDGDDEPADLRGDNQLPELCAALLWATDARRDAEKKERAAKSAILAKVGDHRRAMCEGFWINATEIAGKPETTITADMVGQTLPGRKGSRRVSVKEMTG